MKNSTSGQHTRAVSRRQDGHAPRLTTRGKLVLGGIAGVTVASVLGLGIANTVAERSEARAMDKRVAADGTLTIAARRGENPTLVEQRAYQKDKVPPALAAAIIRAITAQERTNDKGDRMLMDTQAVNIPVDPQAPLMPEYQDLYDATLAGPDHSIPAGDHN